MKPVIIFGTTKMAEISHMNFVQEGQRRIAAFCVDRDFRSQDTYRDLPLRDFDSIEAEFPPSDFDMFVAVGYSKLNSLRAEKCELAKEKGYELASFVSSSAYVSDNAMVGENCVVMAHTVLEPNSRLADGVIIWSGAQIGHDTRIGRHCFIGPQAVCLSGISIAERCFIGANATLRENIDIGEQCIIGAGSVILRSTKPKEVYVASGAEKYRLDSAQFTRFMEVTR